MINIRNLWQFSFSLILGQSQNILNTPHWKAQCQERIKIMTAVFYVLDMECNYIKTGVLIKINESCFIDARNEGHR